MRTFDESARSIRVAQGEAFALELQAQPTSGYAWRAAADDRYLALLEQRFQPADRRVGSASRERLVFRALRPGRCEVVLIYQRAGEPRAHAERTMTVEIE
jgi:predicted secreted protein